MRLILAGLLALTLAACGDSNNNNDDNEVIGPDYSGADFSTADAWLEDFVQTEPAFPGGSYVIVDRANGIVHKGAFGDQDGDDLVLLASTSKVPTVMLLMALAEDDDNVDFAIDAPIANYLPWMGVWDAAITTEHLVSNRSGIPGLVNLFIRPDDYQPHICQYAPFGTLQACGETLFTTPLPALESTPANTAFDYGGSQWQLAGAVAEVVGGSSWNQLWDAYIGEPCGLEVATYGNNLGNAPAWDGNAESLIGLDNPNMEGGMMSNLDDYAKLLSLHLSGGLCGDNRVLSEEGVEFMRIARTDVPAYGMGWWLQTPAEGEDVTLFTDAGFYGSVSWIDTKRQYAGVIFFEEYSGVSGSVGSGGAISQFIPLIEEAIDAVAP
jgi:CubicO group peptidase (beta-lactamase class C family)